MLVSTKHSSAEESVSVIDFDTSYGCKVVHADGVRQQALHVVPGVLMVGHVDDYPYGTASTLLTKVITVFLGYPDGGGLEIFQQHFSDKYKVRKIKRTVARHFIICRSPLIGIRVKLDQNEGKTSFVFDGDAPNALLAVLFWMGLGILISVIIYLTVLKPKLKAMENEVKLYIENAPEFK